MCEGKRGQLTGNCGSILIEDHNLPSATHRCRLVAQETEQGSRHKSLQVAQVGFLSKNSNAVVFNQKYSAVKKLELSAVLFNKQLAYKRLVHTIFQEDCDWLRLLEVRYP